MSWRTVVVQSRAKLSYKNGCMIIRTDDVRLIHLSEINTLIVDSMQVSINSFLLCELIKKKIKVVFCDEKRNPISELIGYYGCHNSSKKLMQQIKWDINYSRLIWTKIIKQKILNQALMLKKYGFCTEEKLVTYADELEYFDNTNREGHAAKVYFNSLFGKGFSRDDVNDINAALNYGYSILLSNFNRELVAIGYSTELGIKHTNEYNSFNLSCDFMEPFRVIVDEIVYNNIGIAFDNEYKLKLVNLLNKRVDYGGKEFYLTNVIEKYVSKVTETIEKLTMAELVLYEFK